MTILKKVITTPGLWIIGLGVVLVVGWYLTREDTLTIETETVAERDLQEMVSATARVKAEDELDLTFEISGVISQLNVDEGQMVEAGQVIARLNTDLLETEVQEAQAAVSAQRAQLEELQAGPTELDVETAAAKVDSARTALENAQESLEDTKEEYDQLVANAREKLLTNDLQAELVSRERSTVHSYEPPTISGVFTGAEEGEYRITLYRSQTDSGYSFRYRSDIDQEGVGSVSTNVPQSLGNYGLRIRFPEQFVRHWDVEWLIKIPNRDSAKYTELRQAYETAKDNRDRAVSRSQRQLREAQRGYDQARSDFNQATAETRTEQVEAQAAALAQAESKLRAAETRLAKAVLTSPVNGLVDATHLSVGELASASTPVVSISTTGDQYLEMFVPEVDVANLAVGDRAEVRLDAFRDQRFAAEVTYVSPTARERDGVASFRTRLTLVESDPRVRIGMTADVDIITAERAGVLAVPGRAILRDGRSNYVRVLFNGRLERREVELGLRGSDGRVEIRSGLEAGEAVITFAQPEDLERLEPIN